MARAGRKDRGLVECKNTAGEPFWKVRLVHDGKERYFSPFETKTEARDFYNKAKWDQHRDKFDPEEFQTRRAVSFQDYATKFLESLPARGVKWSTIKTYRQRLQARLIPAFGAVALRKITRTRIKEWVSDLLKYGLDYDTMNGTSRP